MATHLTSRFCAAAKPKVGPDGKPVQTSFPDDDPVGLELRVSAEGRKVWSFRYRALDGRQRRLTLGVFAPGDEDGEAGDGEARPLTLKAARRKARQARASVEDGGDPATEKRRAKETAKAQPLKTFDELADAYIQACELGEWKPKGKKKRPRTINDEAGIMRRHIRPAIGNLRVEDVTRPVVRKMLRGMVAKGIGAQTNRAQAVVRQVYAWAIAEERVDVNPATGFQPLASESPRQRIVTDAELQAVWKTIRAPNGVMIREEGKEPRALHLSRPMAILLQLSALLLQRRSEVAGMTTAELDLDNMTWLLPGERTKNGKPHLVPLPARAVALIREAITLASLRFEDGKRPNNFCVFPGHRDITKSVRADSVTHALAAVSLACGVSGIAVHDLRRTGASAMASERLGIAPFIVSRVLGHMSDTGGAAAVTLQHYALYDFMPEKRRALDGWADLLLEIVGEQERGPRPDANTGGER